jgi:sugar/nucleoside kinase (ribokinase family)
MGPVVTELRIQSRYRRMIGVGGIGSGMFFRLEGNHTLGRSESRAARIVDARDYCKLHIICHHTAVLLGATREGRPFHVLPLAKIGIDETGQRLKAELDGAGVDVRQIDTVENLPTLFSVCFQYCDGSGGNITTVDSAAGALTPADVDRCLGLLERDGPQTIVLALPEVPLAAREHLLTLGAEHGAFRAAAFTSAEIACGGAAEMLRNLDLIALNQDEAEAVVRDELDPDRPGPFLQNCAEILGAGRSAIRIVITAGRHGAFGLAADEWVHCPAPEVPVVSTAGAGDSLLAGVIAGLVAGMPFTGSGENRPASALEFGVLLGSLSVTSPHTIHPRADVAALLEFTAGCNLSTTELLRYTCSAGVT